MGMVHACVDRFDPSVHSVTFTSLLFASRCVRHAKTTFAYRTLPALGKSAIWYTLRRHGNGGGAEAASIQRLQNLPLVARHGNEAALPDLQSRYQQVRRLLDWALFLTRLLLSCGPMMLDVLLKIKDEQDPSLTLRRSCRYAARWNDVTERCDVVGKASVDHAP